MATIYHITSKEEWRRSIPLGEHTTESLWAEGFIHCSRKEQVVGVANARFAGRDGLALLRIETEDVGAAVVYEEAPGTGQAYPHVYGPLNHDAVKAVIDFPVAGDGSFALPAGLEG